MDIKRYNIKIALIGDGGVGKTSIRRRYMGANFNTNYIETIGADFAQKVVSTDDGYDISYQIWDMAGQERYDRIRSTYYIGVYALLMVYSVTRPDSLENIEKNWIKELIQNNVTKVPIVLIGNKIDLVPEIGDEINNGSNKLLETLSSKLEISEDRVQKIFTSAKSGENIQEAFDLLTKIIVENIKLSEANQ